MASGPALLVPRLGASASFASACRTFSAAWSGTGCRSCQQAAENRRRSSLSTGSTCPARVVSACARVRSDTSRRSISAARSGSRSASARTASASRSDLVGALQRLRYAVLPGALVELGQLRGEGGEPGGEVVGPQPRGAYGVECVARGEQRLAGPLDGRREPGELRLRLAEQRPEPLLRTGPAPP